MIQIDDYTGFKINAGLVTNIFHLLCVFRFLFLYNHP